MLQTSIRRGELDRQVTFLRPIISTGSANSDKIDGWQEVATDPTVYARKKDLGGRDVEIAGRVTYVQRTVWVVDFRTDITSRNRLYEVGEAKVYEIIGVIDYEGARGRYKEIMTYLLDTEEWT
jgi:head-tail adaptor